MDNQTLKSEPNEPAVVKYDGPKHTRGRWTNNQHGTLVYSEFGNVCACGEPHASGYVGYTPTEIGSQYLDEAVANARLIAAAPDMLDALRQWQYAQNNRDAVEMVNAQISRDRAIAKATGAA